MAWLSDCARRASRIQRRSLIDHGLIWVKGSGLANDLGQVLQVQRIRSGAFGRNLLVQAIAHPARTMQAVNRDIRSQYNEQNKVLVSLEMVIRSPRSEELWGEIIHGEQSSMERSALWRGPSRRGELRGESLQGENSSEGRMSSRRECLWGGKVSEEKWPSRRDSLRGEIVFVGGPVTRHSISRVHPAQNWVQSTCNFGYCTNHLY